MFDFFKEVVINSDVLPAIEGTDANGKPFKRFYAFPGAEEGDLKGGASEPGDGLALSPANGDTVFRVLRCADYVKSGVVGGKVYKTVGTRGKCASVEVNLAEASEAGVQYRLLLDISLVNRYYSDYAHPWSEFHKPVMVEWLGTGDATKDAESLMKALKAAIPADYKYAVAVNAEGVVTITCTDPYQVIKAAKLQKVTGNECERGCSAVMYEDVVTLEPEANVAPFATGEWIQENLRFPTYPNLRYASANSDELPIPGALYTQFTFEYCSPRRGLHGQGTVGQMLASVTHHVFYVHSSIAKDFEDAIAKIGTVTPLTPENFPKETL